LTNWYNNGIKTIGQLYNYRKDTYYTFDELKYLYNIDSHEFLNFYSLISAIPNEYKSILYTQGINALTIPEKTFVDIIENSKQINKNLYNIKLQSHSKTDDSIERKWNSCLNLKENLNWRTIYTLPFKSTIDTYLRNFQFKFLSRIIPTNKFLTKCKLTNSSLRDFCQESVETIDHLFWECKYSQSLWTELQKFLKRVKIDIEINKTTAFLGNTEIKLHSEVLNFIIILMKVFIFNMKIKKCIPKFNIFLNYLKLRIHTEEEIALIKNKIETHKQKWIHINQYFSSKN